MSEGLYDDLNDETFNAGMLNAGLLSVFYFKIICQYGPIVFVLAVI